MKFGKLKIHELFTIGNILCYKTEGINNVHIVGLDTDSWLSDNCKIKPIPKGCLVIADKKAFK